jgi:hypothetical protein
LGNNLNTSARKGAAAGFKISGLNKLVQTKSGAGETFLRFIVEGLTQRSPKLLRLGEDFTGERCRECNYATLVLISAVVAALMRARGPMVSLQTLKEDIARMEKGLRLVETMRQRYALG